MKRLKNKKHLLVIILIACFNLTCFDMYNNVWDSMGSNYRMGIFVTTSTVNNYIININSDNSMNQISSVAGNSTGYAGAMADFNRDGNMDMLSVAPDAPHKIWFSDGDGNITGSFDFSALTSNDHANDAAVADFNNDGSPDIFIAASSTGTNKIYLNDGNGSFVNGPVWTFGSAEYTNIVAADFDMDGDKDIFIFQDIAGTDGLSSVFLNNGDGSFSAGVTIPTTSEFAFAAVGDIDNDGDPDIVQASYDSGSGPVTIYKNNGHAIFQGNSVAVSTAVSIALGDIDGDRDLDVYVGTDDGTNIFLINDGNGAFVEKSHALGVSSYTGAVKIVDTDTDGDLDILTDQGGILRIYINDGSLDFDKYKELSLGAVRTVVAGLIYK